jgi:N-methylhydantoinase B
MNAVAEQTSAVDPVTLEIVRERLITIVREMRGNMLRAAFSSAVCELHDMSCAILDHKGQLIALSEGDNPQHIFPILWSATQVLEKFQGDIHPGDIFLHNDPLTGGTHLNDVAMIAPLFVDDRLAYLPVVRVHFEDVGGATPGSISATATDTFQEGVRIPVVRAFSRGEPNQALFDVLLANMRIPHEREGDIDAMLGTVRIAQRRLIEFTQEFDLAAQHACIAGLLDRAETRMRGRIRVIPPGIYDYEIAMDPRGEQMEPLVIRARVEVEGDRIRVDFTGTSAQNRGPWNLGPAGAPTGVFMVLKALLDRTGPVNSGTFRPLEIFTPPGSFLNPTDPVGFGGMGDVRRNLEMAVMGALARVLPDEITGETKSTANQLIISGRHPKDARQFIFYEAPPAGTGGFKEHDGNSAVRTFLEGDFGSLQSVEAIEQKFPLRVEELALRQDSAGTGAHRGGLGFRRQIRVLADEARLTVLSDRNVLPPYGVVSGGPGAPNRFFVRRGNEEIEPGQIPGKIANFPLRKDDVVISESSGGGGYGDPLERPVALIERDLKAGYVSRNQADRTYGAVTSGGRIDPAITERRRAELRSARTSGRITKRANLRPAGALRACVISPTLAKSVGLGTGDVAELVKGDGAPLRCWIVVDPKASDGTLGLAQDSLGLAGLNDGDTVQLRPIGTSAGIATPVWRERLEKIL